MQREAPGIAECARDLQGLELAEAGIAAGVGPTADYMRVPRRTYDRCAKLSSSTCEKDVEAVGAG